MAAMSNEEITARLRRLEKYSIGNRTAIKQNDKKIVANHKSLKSHKNSITQVTMDCQGNYEALQRADDQWKKQASVMKNNKVVVNNMDKIMNKLDNEVLNNTLFRQHIQIDNNREIAAQLMDNNNNNNNSNNQTGINCKCGAIFMLNCMKK